MTLQFQQVPTGTLDLENGKVTGTDPGAAQHSPPPPIGMPLLDFIGQISDLAQKGIGLDKANAAIDAHPAITNKPAAKALAAKMYQSYPQPTPTLEQLVQNPKLKPNGT